LPREAIDRIVEEQRWEIKRRIDVLRGGRALLQIKGKAVILVDDGIAMGSTMRAGIMLCKNQGASKIVVAAPVSGKGVAMEIEELVDEVVVLENPRSFAQWPRSTKTGTTSLIRRYWKLWGNN
jgi:predicted phosphoribosyltransferase